MTCDLWCSRTSFYGERAAGESGRIAVQKAGYFAEGSHAELDGLSNESNADRSEIPSSGKGAQSLEADMVLLTDSLAELFKCQPATRLAWIHEDLARVVASDRALLLAGSSVRCGSDIRFPVGIGDESRV